MTSGMPGLGRYVPRRSPVHALDARAKLLAALLFVAAACFGSTLQAQIVLFAVLLAGFALARLPLGVLARGARSALWLVAFVVLANAGWFVLARRTGWGGGEEAIGTPVELAVLVLRLLNLLAVAALTTATTVPVDAAEAFERLLRPLARLGVPVHELGFMFVLALSFVPLFGREARRLADAHRIKVGKARWGMRDRIRAAVPLLVPLFLGVLRRADELAVALDARCFVPAARRTSLLAQRARPQDALALAVGGACLAVCLALRP